MTREQKIMRARGLRKLGWTARQIAHELGVNESTVRNWYLGGDCANCGAPLDGSNGEKSKHCENCAPDAHRIWTREAIIAALHDVHRQTGKTPRAADLRPHMAHYAGWSDADELTVRFAANHWPTTTTVAYVFGSWNAALEAAGFEAGHGARWVRERAAA